MAVRYLLLIFCIDYALAFAPLRVSLQRLPPVSLKRSLQPVCTSEPGSVLGGIFNDVSSLWGRVAGSPSTDLTQLAEQEPAPAEDLDFVPLVLVVGATGRTGRIVVRKLLLRGFRVAVLVRSLSTDTLNLLGSGVSYSYGDISDYRSLLGSMEDVDKVVFAASAEEREHNVAGLRNVVRAFQDTRTFTYGDAEATKLSLFKFQRDSDLNSWSVETTHDEIAERLARAGLSARTSVAYWKRSEAHRNAVFVGNVFDVYLGSAVVSCDLAGPTSQPMGLGEYSGLVAKLIGDGKTYTVIVRTSLFQTQGIEYHADIQTAKGTFTIARLPFSSFLPHKDGQLVTDSTVGELDRRQLVGLGLAFYPQRSGAKAGEGSFYCSVKHIKAFRERDEPEVVYISDAAAERSHDATHTSDLTQKVVENNGVADDVAQEGASQAALDALHHSRTDGRDPAERLLRASGLTYFILRPGQLDDRPGGVRRLALTQSGPAASSVSRADLAEVVVRSLLDPRACNVACTISDSEYLSSQGRQDISKMIELLEPEL